MSDNPFEAEKQRIHQAAVDAMKEGMYIIQADTQQLCPVKTGALKRSYTSGVEEDNENITGWVGSNLDYAVWADLHTPHLTEAVDKDQEAVRQKLTQALGGS
ncbi:MAG: HK97 gp10 family phage protein [Clostridiaceae bacterium]|nr:HK97 gp10 family phage protein [Clostridiaceae bacterium]